MVNGLGYLTFSEHFLEPLFKKQVEVFKSKISEYDEAVKASLSAKGRPVRAKSVKGVLSVSHQTIFACKKCGNRFESLLKLKRHKVSYHSNSLNFSENSVVSIKHSTRNNSFSEEMLLCDNITLEIDMTKSPNNDVQKCTGDVSSSSNLQKHVTEVHEEDGKMCDICRQIFQKQQDLDYHKNEKHEDKIQCEISDLKPKDIPDQQDHTPQMHIEDSDSREMCQQKFEAKEDEEKHDSEKHSVNTETCEICQKNCEDRNILKKHKLEEHAESEVNECNLCCSKFSGEEDLKSHMKSEHVSDNSSEEQEKSSLINKVYECEEIECKFGAKNAREMVTHFLNVHNLPSISLKCDYCDFVAFDEKLLNVHKVNKHDGADFSPIELIKVFYNAIGTMIQETNERIEKYNEDTNRTLIYLMDTQSNLVDSVDFLKNEALKTNPLVKENDKKVKTNVEEPVEKTEDEKEKEVMVNNNSNENNEIKLNKDLDEKQEDVMVDNSTNENDEIKIDEDLEDDHEEPVVTNGKTRISWIGTSVSKALDKEKVEKDTNTDISITQVYCIKEEESDRLSKNNVKDMVPKVVVKEKPDILVLQTGSTELTNIKVNAAMMDTTRDIEDHKKDWFKKVEKDSIELYKIAEEASKRKKNLKVIIVKRLPRFDRASQDIIGIKTELSNFANTVLDQEWIKQGRPSHIQIVEMQLNLDRSNHIRNLVYGSRSSENYDGVHLSGPGAKRHFSYRAAQLIKQFVFPNNNHGGSSLLSENRTSWRSTNDDDHTFCPQARYAREQMKLKQNVRFSQHLQVRNRNTNNRGTYSNIYGTYSDAVVNGPTYRTFRGQNIYNHLN